MGTNSKIIVLSVIILAGVGYAYFFTDFLLSSPDKIIKEIEYYEELRFQVVDYAIQDYLDMWWDVNYSTPQTVEVTKNELRTRVPQSLSRSIEKLGERYPAGTYVYYDKKTLSLWTLKYNTERIPVGVDVFYWSPEQQKFTH